MDRQKNNDQARLATIIPASYWISIGYSEEDASLMEKLQNDIKKFCEDNNDDTKIDLRGRMEPGTVLPHHDMMIPHWQKLFRALNGRTLIIKQFSIIGISLPVQVLDIMLPVLQSVNLEKFGSASVGLGRDGFLKLTSFLRGNTSIKQLILGGDDLIDDMSVASSLSDAMRNHPNLELLILVACGLNNAGILGKILEGCKRLDFITIANFNVGSEGVDLLADFIHSNHSTRYFDLPRNNLSDNDALILASALKKNTNLQRLKLEHNNITEDGEKPLLKALFDASSMNSIIESNHTCIPNAFDLSSTRPFLELELFVININDAITVKQKIRKKVVLALCGVEEGGLFDLSHFNDLPLGVMPRVLEMIQEHTDMRTKVCHKYAPGQLEKDALTRLFHTLRGWELPLLFENLNGSSTNAGELKKKQTRRLIEDLDNLKIL